MKFRLTCLRFYDIVEQYEIQPILRSMDTPTAFLVSGDSNSGGEYHDFKGKENSNY